jgi:hypothetical protein
LTVSAAPARATAEKTAVPTLVPLIESVHAAQVGQAAEERYRHLVDEKVARDDPA